MSSSARLSLAELCNQPLPPPPPHPSSSSSSSPASSSAASSPSSPMTSPDVVHAGIKRPLAIEDHDEDVRIAARALGDMRSRAVAHARAPSAEAFAAASKVHSRTSSASQSTPFLSPSTTPSTISNSSPQLRQRSLDRDHHTNHYHHHQESPSSENSPPPSKDFVSRVVHSPIVSSVLNAYEDSKKRSKVVQIGANLMESSVKTISRPVINRLPVNQLDEFACRQLDRIYPIRSAPSSPNADTPKINNNNHLYTAYRDPALLESGASSRAPSVAPDDYSTSNSPILPIRNLSDDHEKGNKARDDMAPADARSSQQQQQQPSPQQEIAAKSKWQTMLCEAGGISAAVSQESMKRLQYCLQWLQYATNRIDTQIVVLRSFIDSLTPNPPHENDPHALVPLQVMRTLADVRRDLLKTIREVVKVISTYAGGALPEPARSTVRTFILRLPARLSSATGGDASNPPSMPSSPRMQQQQRLPSSENLAAGLTSNGPLPPIPIPAQNGHAQHSSRPTAGRATHPTALAATQAAQRVLTLATESLDMMLGVTNVFKESLERADAWVERFRIVGIQRHDGTSTSNSLHMLSSPGAGPSNSTSNSNNSAVNVPTSPTSPSREEEEIKSPSEPDLHVHYSSASSVHSSVKSHDATQTSSSSTTTTSEVLMMKKRRKRISDNSAADENITSTNTADANSDSENGHTHAGDIQNSRSTSREEVEEENDETETEDAAVPFIFSSCTGSTRTTKRGEEKIDDDMTAAGTGALGSAGTAGTDDEIEIPVMVSHADDGDSNNNLRKRNGFSGSAVDADDCSDASFYSAKTRSMDIDCD